VHASRYRPGLQQSYDMNTKLLLARLSQTVITARLRVRVILLEQS